MEKKEYKESPIFYMGNKFKLIQKGLIDLFPQNIDKFIEPFCGSGVISLNTKANRYILIDKNEHIIDLLNMFKNIKSEEIVNGINANIEKFNILKGFNKRSTKETEEYKARAKKNYLEFRRNFNQTQNIIDLYTLSYYCNSNNIRFNSKGEFNMPIGNQYFNPAKHCKKINNGCEFFSKSNLHIRYGDYKEIKSLVLSENDFVYLDPPYLGTTAIYNENNGWTEKEEEEMYAMIEELNANGIKFGMSNTFKNKGISNTKLIEWCEKNKFNVKHFEGFTYVACGKGNSETDEVYIYNYDK